MPNGKVEHTNALSLSGTRLQAVYQLTGDEAWARETAKAICVEQTVEFPLDLIDEDDIREQMVGRVTSIDPDGENRYRATVEYPVEAAGPEITQLLNLLFGNISLIPGIRLVDFTLTDDMLAAFQGPRFGRQGLRDLLRAKARPLIAAIIKPMGLSNRKLADLAYRFALGGCDIIKDDHGLADQPFSRFADRVKRVGEKVALAREKTNRHCLYFAKQRPIPLSQH
jgi:ribulose-bisphosphate carboxylase large chain